MSIGTAHIQQVGAHWAPFYLATCWARLEGGFCIWGLEALAVGSFGESLMEGVSGGMGED